MDDRKKRDGIRDYRKCPAHNMWMKKGQCIICIIEQEKRMKELEQQTGSNKQEVKITKI